MATVPALAGLSTDAAREALAKARLRAGAVTVSPDDRNVYVASEDTYLGSVAVFRRLAR